MNSYKNLAIIVGITQYENSALDLPGCKNDVEIMEIVLRRGGVFQDVIVVKNQKSELLKEELFSIIDRFKNDDIGDVLFYFSGHGNYSDEDFHYQLSDYEKNKSLATSLSNKQLDDLLRGLNPSLITKIIDACNSGITYVKDGKNPFDNIKTITKGEYPSCYFYFSSQNDQKSYADSHMSYFTKAFAKSIVDKKLDVVRHVSIMESISDAFQNSDNQAPEFVMQGKASEIFGRYDNSAKDAILALLPAENTDQVTTDTSRTDSVAPGMLASAPEATENVSDEITINAPKLPETTASISSLNPISLAEHAAIASAKYVTFEKASEFVSTIHVYLRDYMPKNTLESIYAIDRKFFSDYSNIPNVATVGKWLTENKNNVYFAEAVYGNEDYYTSESSSRFGIHSMSDFLGRDPTAPREIKTIKKTRTVVTEIKTDQTALPFLRCVVSLNPQQPILLKYSGTFIFLLSKTRLQIFSCYSEHKEISWDEFEIGLTTQWKRIVLDLVEPDSISAVVAEFYDALFDWVTEKLYLRLGYNPYETEYLNL